MREQFWLHWLLIVFFQQLFIFQLIMGYIDLLIGRGLGNTLSDSLISVDNLILRQIFGKASPI